MTPNDILTAHEVATLLRVHYSTVMRLVRERKIPAFRLGIGGRGGDWRFVRSELERWMNKGDGPMFNFGFTRVSYSLDPLTTLTCVVYLRDGSSVVPFRNRPSEFWTTD